MYPFTFSLERYGDVTRGLDKDGIFGYEGYENYEDQEILKEE
jgi:hypothetical protein